MRWLKWTLEIITGTIAGNSSILILINSAISSIRGPKYNLRPLISPKSESGYSYGLMSKKNKSWIFLDGSKQKMRQILEMTLRRWEPDKIFVAAVKSVGRSMKKRVWERRVDKDTEGEVDKDTEGRVDKTTEGRVDKAIKIGAKSLLTINLESLNLIF